MNAKINHLAVWILIVVYFLIGWGWYAIFGEKWLNLHARTMTDIEHTHNASAYVLAFFASIVVNYTLAVHRSSDDGALRLMAYPPLLTL